MTAYPHLLKKILYLSVSGKDMHVKRYKNRIPKIKYHAKVYQLNTVGQLSPSTKRLISQCTVYWCNATGITMTLATLKILSFIL